MLTYMMIIVRLNCRPLEQCSRLLWYCCCLYSVTAVSTVHTTWYTTLDYSLHLLAYKLAWLLHDHIAFRLLEQHGMGEYVYEIKILCRNFAPQEGRGHIIEGAYYQASTVHTHICMHLCIHVCTPQNHSRHTYCVLQIQGPPKCKNYFPLV